MSNDTDLQVSLNMPNDIRFKSECKSTHLSTLLDHNVVRVSIGDAQHVGGHAVAGTAHGELLNSFVEATLRRVLLLQPVCMECNYGVKVLTSISFWLLYNSCV